jgi:hypothetical protein
MLRESSSSLFLSVSWLYSLDPQPLGVVPGGSVEVEK